ncbi:hypothetical protein Bbelb_034940 [Branchiostoma belcheri]|nr:hypothetical protein Bbelb_034940 [Branchiostoma belcheri]
MTGAGFLYLLQSPFYVPPGKDHRRDNYPIAVWSSVIADIAITSRLVQTTDSCSLGLYPCEWERFCVGGLCEGWRRHCQGYGWRRLLGSSQTIEQLCSPI